MNERKQPAAEGGDILRDMSNLQVHIGISVHGIDYLMDNGAPANLIGLFIEKHNRQLAEAVAQLTGGNADEIADAKKRTPEQEKLMIEVSARATAARMKSFFESDYEAAYNIIEKRYSGDRKDPLSDDEMEALFYIPQYFFARHPELEAMDNGNLGDAERAELTALIDKALEIRASDPRKSLLEAISAAIGVKLDASKASGIGKRIKLEQLSSLIPTRHVIPNNKLTNQLTDDIIDTGSYELTVAGKGKNAVTTICVLTYEGDNVKLTGRQSFTEYDRNVYNAVTSLFVYGDEAHIVTPAMVYRAMVNMTETETPSAQQIGAVTRSLDKMRFIRARVDCTEELKRRGASVDGEQITGGMIDTYLLTADAVTVEAGGKKVKAYRIIKTPILYEYSSLIKQVLTVPAALLDVKAEGQRVKNTEQRIAIKGYLLRRIEVMKGKTKQSTHILFDAIYSATGEESPNDIEKKRIREYVFTVLDYWQEQGHITGYSSLRSGTTYTGIDVMPA